MKESIWEISDRCSEEETLAIAKEKALNDDKEAICYLVNYSKNNQDILKYAKQGAENKINECLIEYGVISQNSGNIDLALDCFTRAEKANSLEARALLAILLIQGEDVLKGVDCLLRSDNEDDGAMGVRYLDFSEIPVDIVKKTYEYDSLKEILDIDSFSKFDQVVKYLESKGFKSNKVDLSDVINEIGERYIDKYDSFLISKSDMDKIFEVLNKYKD